MPDIEDFFSWFGASLLLVAALLLTTIIGCSLYSNGNIDYCWIETTAAPRVAVMGHRPWRSDLVVASVATYGEALQAATASACPLWKP